MRNLCVAVLLAALATLVACSEEEGSAKLRGAHYLDIPVYEPSDLVDTEDHFYSAGSDFSDLRSYHGILWTLRTPEAFDKVVAFYEGYACEDEEEEAEEVDDYDLEDENDEEETSDERTICYQPAAASSPDVEITVKRDTKSGQTLILIHEGVLRSARK